MGAMFAPLVTGLLFFYFGRDFMASLSDDTQTYIY